MCIFYEEKKLENLNLLDHKKVWKGREWGSVEVHKVPKPSFSEYYRFKKAIFRIMHFECMLYAKRILHRIHVLISLNFFNI